MQSTFLNKRKPHRGYAKLTARSESYKAALYNNYLQYVLNNSFPNLLCVIQTTYNPVVLWEWVGQKQRHSLTAEVHVIKGEMLRIIEQQVIDRVNEVIIAAIAERPEIVQLSRYRLVMLISTVGDPVIDASLLPVMYIGNYSFNLVVEDRDSRTHDYRLRA